MKIVKSLEESGQQVSISMPLHPLTNFEIQKHCQNELKLNDVY